MPSTSQVIHADPSNGKQVMNRVRAGPKEGLPVCHADEDLVMFFTIQLRSGTTSTMIAPLFGEGTGIGCSLRNGKGRCCETQIIPATALSPHTASFLRRFAGADQQLDHFHGRLLG